MGVWTITSKELRLLAHDRRALVLLLLMPLLLIAILGFSTGKLFGRRDENAVLRLVLVDEDRGALATELTQALRSRPGVELRLAPDRQTARDQVDDGPYMAAVIVGAQFGAQAERFDLRDVLAPKEGRLAAGLGNVDIVILCKPSLVITGAVIEQMVLSETLRVLLPHIARRDPLVRAYLNSQGDTAAAHSPEPKPLSSFQTDRDNVVFQVLVPSYVVLFTFFLINIMARSFIHERHMGTLFRLRAAPIGAASLLAGQTLPFFLISLVQGVLLFVFGRLLFGMSWGSTPAMLLPVLVCTSLAATGLGLLTATLVRSDAQVSAYANLVVIGFAGISGCFMPRDWLPDTVRQISLATPHAWALIGYNQLLVHPAPNVARVWLCCAALLGFAAGFAVIAWTRFRRVA